MALTGVAKQLPERHAWAPSTQPQPSTATLIIILRSEPSLQPQHLPYHTKVGALTGIVEQLPERRARPPACSAQRRQILVGQKPRRRRALQRGAVGQGRLPHAPAAQHRDQPLHLRRRSNMVSRTQLPAAPACTSGFRWVISTQCQCFTLSLQVAGAVSPRIFPFDKVALCVLSGY